MELVKDKSDLLKIFEERFKSFESSLNGDASSKLHQNRKEAFKILSDQDFPGRKNEEYKYTPITRILEKELKGGGLSDQKNQTDLLELLKTDSGIDLLVFRNGVFDEKNSTHSIQEGLELQKLSDASSKGEEFDTYFNKAIPGEKDSFALLNTTFSKEGFYLHLKKNKKADKTIIMLHLNDGDEESSITNPRNLLVFEEGSQATFIECFQTSSGTVAFTNSLTEFIVKRNANVKYIRLGLDSQNTIRVSTDQVYQENDSNFTSTAVDFGGKAVRNNLNIVVGGTGCESNMFGLYLLNGSSHVDNHTTIDHTQPNCESHELYKGILGGNSRGVFNGKIYVRQAAQKTNAFQQNNNILLSDDAVVNTKPQLEIWADDVKCSHGCTSGQIDEEQIFYLRSRGIDEASAKKMLLHAYAAEILGSIEHKILNELAEKMLSEMLAEM